MSASGNYIVESDIDNWPMVIDDTDTFVAGDVDSANDKITGIPDIPAGTELQFSSTGVLPTPLVTGTVYFAIRIDATTIRVATNPVDAAAGTVYVDLTDGGSGTHKLDIGSGSSTVDRQATIDRAEQLIEKLTRDYFYVKTFSIYRDGNNDDLINLNLQPNIITDTSRLYLSDLAMVQDSTTLTSVTGGFTVGMIGEKIYISGGTNFISGWYEITGHTDTNTVILDSTAATAGNGEKGKCGMGGIVEILLSGVELSNSWWVYDTVSIYLDPEAATADDLPELLLRLKYKQGLFPKGTGNIKITGTYGWTSCPVAIKRAAIILCRFENDETLYTMYDDVDSDKLADAAYSRGTKKFLTGIHEADKLIRNYVRNKMMLEAC